MNKPFFDVQNPFHNGAYMNQESESGGGFHCLA